MVNEINQGPCYVKNYLTPLCMEAAASIDQKLDAPSRRSIKTRHYYDHEMHKTTCNCAHLVPDFFFVHMVCGIFTQDLSIFLSSCHCHAHTWHRFLESAETQCYICTYVYDFFHSQLLVWSIVTLNRMQWAKFSNLKGHTLKNETFNSNQQIERKGRKSWYRKILKLVIRSYSRTATDL